AICGRHRRILPGDLGTYAECCGYNRPDQNRLRGSAALEFSGRPDSHRKIPADNGYDGSLLNVSFQFLCTSHPWYLLLRVCKQEPQFWLFLPEVGIKAYQPFFL